jgi:hypothetical protein
MGGANTSSTSTTPGGAFNPQAPVQKATQATAADLAAFDAEQLQNKRIAQGLDFLGQGISGTANSSPASTPASAALASQNQADNYKKLMEMQLSQKDSDSLNFMPQMPFNLQSTNPELVNNAWADAVKTLVGSALSGAGQMYKK